MSGRAGLDARLGQLGFNLSRDELNDAFEAFKALADRKREVTDADLEALMSNQRRTVDVPAIYQLEHVQVSCGDHDVSDGYGPAQRARWHVDGCGHGHRSSRRRLSGD